MNIDKKRDIYIWGQGPEGVLIAFDCEQKGIKVTGFINSEMIIRPASSIPILTPEEYFKIILMPPRHHPPYIIIAISNELQRKEVVMLLLKNGFKEKKDFDLCLVEKMKNMSLLQRSEILKKMILLRSEKWIERYKTKFSPIKHTEDSKNRRMIYIAKDIMNIGGLTHRFAALISYYHLSKKLKVEFKINWTQPVDLANFIVPNTYDWLTNNDIILDKEKAVLVSNNYRLRRYYTEEFDCLIEMLLTEYEQVIVTGTAVSHENYGVSFKELFKPSEELQKQISHHLQLIGNNFISVIFRFQQLLGDFKEEAESYPVLKKDEQKNLINRCVEHLQDVHYENPDEKIFVASDSITFLDAIKNFDFVYTIPAAIIVHLHTSGLDMKTYMKGFLDYFLLTYSKKIYTVVDGLMYKSGFGYTASLHNNIPYIVKEYNIEPIEEIIFRPEINIKESILQGRKLYVWGTGHYGLITLIQCRKNNWKISAFLDSNIDIKEFNGYKVKRPEQILNETKRDFFIIISSIEYREEMEKVCERYGLKKGVDFWKPS